MHCIEPHVRYKKSRASGCRTAPPSARRELTWLVGWLPLNSPHCYRACVRHTPSDWLALDEQHPLLSRTRTPHPSRSMLDEPNPMVGGWRWITRTLTMPCHGTSHPSRLGVDELDLVEVVGSWCWMNSSPWEAIPRYAKPLLMNRTPFQS
jgi:hypothetical protein